MFVEVSSAISHVMFIPLSLLSTGPKVNSACVLLKNTIEAFTAMTVSSLMTNDLAPRGASQEIVRLSPSNAS